MDERQSEAISGKLGSGRGSQVDRTSEIAERLSGVAGVPVDQHVRKSVSKLIQKPHEVYGDLTTNV